MKLEVRKVKSLSTRDGVAWTCDLYVDGQRAASCENEGRGGCTRFWFADRDLENRVRAWVAANPDPRAEESLEGEELDALVECLCDDYDTNQRFKRICKTKTMYRTPDMPDGEWLVMKAPFSLRVRAVILSKRPDAVFANDRFATAEAAS